MSTVNVVRFFIYKDSRFNSAQLKKLVDIAYLAARDRKLFPKEILIRSGIHNTTTINGRYQSDPDGPHTTLCYKDDGQIQRGTHVASHGYVASMTDWTYTGASHRPEKPDGSKKKGKQAYVWPSTEDLQEVTTIAYSHLAGFMEDWAKEGDCSEALASMNLSGEPSTAASTDEGAGSSVQRQDEGPPIAVAAEDPYIVVEKKQGHKYKLRLPDGSSVVTPTSSWQEGMVYYEEAWTPCFVCVVKGATCYWTWVLDPGKRVDGKGMGKGKGSK